MIKVTAKYARFSLKHLVIALTLVAVCLGIWMWKHKQRMEAARQLADSDVGILSVSDAPEFVPESERMGPAFARPAMAELYVHLQEDGEIYLNGQSVTLDEAKRSIESIQKRIEDLGIKHVHLMFVAKDCSIQNLLTSKRSGEMVEAFRKFTEAEQFASTGFLESNQVDERKRNLDPNGLVHER